MARSKVPGSPKGITPKIIETPRTLSYNGATFTDADVQFLKSQFLDLDMSMQYIVDVRNSTVWSNAISSAIVVIRIVNPTAQQVTINLTQAGRQLLGKV